MITIKNNTNRVYEVFPPDKDGEICIEIKCNESCSSHDVYLSKENLEELLKLFEN